MTIQLVIVVECSDVDDKRTDPWETAQDIIMQGDAVEFKVKFVGAEWEDRG